MSWTVRLASISDLEFLVHCNKSLALDTEGKTLNHETLTKGVTDCLNNPKLGCYYIAADKNGASMGSTLVTHEVSLAAGGMVNWI